MCFMVTFFVFLNIFIVSSTQQHHSCIHDKVVQSVKPQKINTQYSSRQSSNPNKRRRLNHLDDAESSEYQTIRIRPYWQTLESSSNLTVHQINQIKSIVSSSIRYFESTLSVIPILGRLYYPRTCDTADSVSYFGPTSYYHNCRSFSESTTCGAAPIPTTFFRNDWLYHSDGSINTTLYPSGPGVIDADLVLFVTASNLHCTSSSIAWTVPCILDQNGRPLFGTINFCPSSFSALDLWRESVMVIMHELTHLLGFSSSLYPHYKVMYNENRYNTNDFNISDIIASDINSLNGTMTNHWIITPSVQQIAKSYFNCNTLIGAPLENNDEDPTSSIHSNVNNQWSSHWEEHFSNGEYMTAYTDTKPSYFSAFTFALLQDTGWYLVDFDFAQPRFQWGYHRNCDFFENQCFTVNPVTDGDGTELNHNNSVEMESKSNYPEYFCNPNINTFSANTYCTADHLSIGSCIASSTVPKEIEFQYFGVNGSYGYSSSEYCPYVDALSLSSDNEFHFECTEPIGNEMDDISSRDVPWNYSLSSRCINTEVIKSEIQIHSAFCFPILCGEYDPASKQWNHFDVIIGNSSIRCNRNETLSVKQIPNIDSNHWMNLELQSMECPDIDVLCINEQPFECRYGSWNDQKNQCICDPGYIGDSCSIQDHTTLMESASIGNTSSVDDDGVILNDLCAFIIGDSTESNRNLNRNLIGNWKFMGYTAISPYYVMMNGMNRYYLYFDGWYHTWNIGTVWNDRYTKDSVFALCDIGERPGDVTKCSHQIYFADEGRHVWTQDVRFIFVEGSCGDLGDGFTCNATECNGFNASQWTSNTFVLATNPPIMNTTTNDLEDESTTTTSWWIDVMHIGITLLAVLLLIFVCFLFVWNRKLRIKRLNHEVSLVQCDAINPPNMQQIE